MRWAAFFGNASVSKKEKLIQRHNASLQTGSLSTLFSQAVIELFRPFFVHQDAVNEVISKW